MQLCESLSSLWWMLLGPILSGIVQIVMVSGSLSAMALLSLLPGFTFVEWQTMWTVQSWEVGRVTTCDSQSVCGLAFVFKDCWPLPSEKPYGFPFRNEIPSCSSMPFSSESEVRATFLSMFTATLLLSCWLHLCTLMLTLALCPPCSLLRCTANILMPSLLKA